MGFTCGTFYLELWGLNVVDTVLNKKLVHNWEANICELACNRHDVCDLWFHGVQVVEGDSE
jgi:hypothetical protein